MSLKARVNWNLGKDINSNPQQLVVDCIDETIFKIDKITNICLAASLKAGGAGIRYTCIINGTQKILDRKKNYVKIVLDRKKCNESVSR